MIGNYLTKNLFDSDFDTQDNVIEDFEIVENYIIVQNELEQYDNFVKAVMICRQWKLKMTHDPNIYSI